MFCNIAILLGWPTPKCHLGSFGAQDALANRNYNTTWPEHSSRSTWPPNTCTEFRIAFAAFASSRKAKSKGIATKRKAEKMRTGFGGTYEENYMTPGYGPVWKPMWTSAGNMLMATATCCTISATSTSSVNYGEGLLHR